jgi:hypothetical protein
MKTRFASLTQLMALAVLACCCFSTFATAQDNNQNDSTARGRFVVMPKPVLSGVKPANTLQEWNGSYTYNNTQYNFVMVGADPSTNATATVTTYLIPIVFQIGSSTFDPTVGPKAPKTPFDSPFGNVVTSPIFDKTTDYVQGGTDLGATQYIDAFQRGNFWSIVQNNPNSHLLLAPNVLPKVVLNVPAQYGRTKTEFGCTNCGEVDINWFDSQLPAIMAAYPQITPDTFPIFVTYNTYLTEGSGFSCCIGGYHSNNGPQTYAHFTYIGVPGAFSQDVSALSHEVGEWADDPLYPQQNNSPCGILEVGDPLEGTANYGTWPYTLHGFTYHLQDLVFIGYFGAPLSTSVNSWWSFQNYPFTRICQNGS